MRSPLPWLGGLLALYLLVPIAAFLVRLGGGVSSTPGLGAALFTSLLTATISTVAIALLGVPLAYLLARWHGPAGRLALALVALPLALPPLMSGLLLLYVTGPYTAAGRLFGGDLTDTRVGIVLAQTFVAAPFLLVAARAAFASVDPALEDMARALGHGRLARFWRVAVPSALPGIGAGLLLAWLRSFGEFGATIILAYHPYSLPVFTFVQFDASGLPATMLPIAVALAAALAVLLLTGLRTPRRRRRPSGVPTPSGPPPSLARDRPAAALDFALSKRLGGFSLALEHHAASPRLALLGPSGAGKTLTLRLLAGLTPSEGGHVRAGGCALDALASERRELGYVPQQAALLPRRTVWRQVMFGRRARAEHAAWWLSRLGLAGLEDRYPDELSGGQQRRVALARALATEPRVLLLDEPFTGLDAPVRERLRRELRSLQREGGLSSVIVTHDPQEAAMLADELIVIDDGRELQSGSTGEVFRAPRSPQVAALLGIANARRGRIARPDTLESAGVEIHARTPGLDEGCEVVWCVRPERIHVQELDGHGRRRSTASRSGADDETARRSGADDRMERRSDADRGEYAAAVLDDVDLGTVRELTVVLADRLELTVRTNAARALRAGTRLRLRIAPEDVSVWGAERSAAGDTADDAAWPGPYPRALARQPPM